MLDTFRIKSNRERPYYSTFSNKEVKGVKTEKEGVS